MLMDRSTVEAFLQGDDDAMQLVRERGRRIKAAAELGLARSSRGRQWGRALGRRALLVLPKDDPTAVVVPAARQPMVKKQAARGEEDGEVVVEEKVAMLRRLVPGAEDMEVEGLLEETADYIAALKAQVGVMRALACMLSGADASLDALPDKADGHVIITPEN